MAARGRVLDRTRLIDAVFGADAVVTDRTIDVHITALRKKLLAGAGWVQTVRGVGYTFRSPAQRETVAN
jgi:DNA-binding response OmpR family regulator